MAGNHSRCWPSSCGQFSHAKVSFVQSASINAEKCSRSSPDPAPDDRKCRLLVVKIASRCNLNCSYCYVYNAGDRSYLHQPAIMSDDVADALIWRTANHCRRHAIAEFTFVFHGGEPLLAGPAFLRRFVAGVAGTFPATTRLRFCLQTNGTLLTQEWCRVLAELNIGIGISLDGPQQFNDLYRLDHSGRGSYDRVMAGWNAARLCGLRPGLLAVINLQIDPLEVYRHAKELGPSSLDFLFPDATHDKLPPGRFCGEESTSYADWLLKIFNAWVAEDESPFRIRLFSYLMRTILGGNDSFDNFSQDPNEVMIIETNGAIESLDVLKICGDGITKSEANVLTHELDQAFANEMIKLYYNSGRRLSATCEACLVKSVCAGGYLPHRHSQSNGFDNPSVYCFDLMKLITSIQNWISSNLPDKIRLQTGLIPVTYDQARAHLRAFHGIPG
jgi:uncharacterized protein